jgi:hypothetical protein
MRFNVLFGAARRRSNRYYAFTYFVASEFPMLSLARQTAIGMGGQQHNGKRSLVKTHIPNILLQEVKITELLFSMKRSLSDD